jgi:hypothetical protein
MSILPRAALRALCLLALPTVALADVRIVGAGQTYANVQAAINAANPGDTILVRAGTYPGFLVDGKELQIVGDAVVKPTITSMTTVRNLITGERVSLGHLFLRGGLIGHTNSGALRVADCQIGQLASPGEGCSLLDSIGGTVIASSTIYGMRGVQQYGYAGEWGGDGLTVRGAVVALHDCAITGGSGAGDPGGAGFGGRGGSAAYVGPSSTPSLPTFLHASGSSFNGGAGGDALPFGVSGDGGSGFVVASGASAWRIECSYAGGLEGGGTGICIGYGQPGAAEVVSGFAATFHAPRVQLSGPVLARESTSIALAIDGAPGDYVVLRSSVAAAFDPLASSCGVRLTQAFNEPWFLTNALDDAPIIPMNRAIARLDANGHADVSFQLPALVATETARTGYLQVLRVTSGGSSTLGGFLPLTIVDSSY